MQPLADNPERKPPSRAWKKKYECKKGKGEHVLVLVKPHYNFIPKDLTAEEYYTLREKEYHECISDGTYWWCGFTRRLRHYECTVCGKRIIKEI